MIRPPPPVQVQPTDPCNFENWGQAIYHFKCDNNTNNYWETTPQVPYHGPHINVCFELHPADPTETWQSKAMQACSDNCAALADRNGFDTENYDEGQCAKENWSDVDPTGLNCMWDWCTEETPGLNFDLIESVLGFQEAADAQDLPCDLAFDCSDFLDPAAATALWTEPYSGVEQTADTLMISSAASELYVIGAGQGTGTTEDLTGAAAFTATSCGADACPFYLAQYELEGTSSSFNVTLTPGSAGSLTKTISGFSLQLAQPALGMWLPSSGDVIFPSASLRFRVSATVSGTPQPYGENGYYEEVYTVYGYVFGFLDPMTGDFIMGATTEDSLGDFTVSGVFVEI